MDLDFALILTVLTLVTGLIWLFDIVFMKPGRKARVQAKLEALQRESEEPVSPAVVENVTNQEMREPLLAEYAHSFFPVLALVWVLRSFVLEPFTIPSGSMLPTLEVGDYILVNKFAYGLRLPVIGTKILPIGEPQRGDIIVFKYPKNPSVNYIKRLVGLPGDHISTVGNKVFINGKLLEEVQTDDSKAQEAQGNAWELFYTEQLGKHTHITRQLAGEEGPTVDVVVPQGQYFMMGDNRNESADSRYWGFVPDQNIVGKAFFVWIHKKPGLNLPTFGRNGMVD